MHENIVPVELHKAYRLLNHGPTILVSAQSDGVTDVMAAAWASPLSFDPPRLSVVLAKMTKTRELVEERGVFVIQIPTFGQLALTQSVGSTSLHTHADKLQRAGVSLFTLDHHSEPFVMGCSAWLLCRLVEEPAIQESYDLFFGEIIGAWADARAFSNGHWHFESADKAWRSIHHVAGGHFYTVGDYCHAGEVAESTDLGSVE